MVLILIVTVIALFFFPFIAYQIYKRTQCKNYFLTSEEEGQPEENDGPTGEINAAFESDSLCKSHRSAEQPHGSVADF